MYSADTENRFEARMDLEAPSDPTVFCRETGTKLEDVDDAEFLVDGASIVVVVIGETGFCTAVASAKTMVLRARFQGGRVCRTRRAGPAGRSYQDNQKPSRGGSSAAQRVGRRVGRPSEAGHLLAGQTERRMPPGAV